MICEAEDEIKGNLQKALDYANAGWKIFPLNTNKMPFKGTNGFKDATTNKATIEAWWVNYPYALIGLPCGDNGLVVMDFDIHKTGSENAIAEFESWCGVSLADHPYVVRTQNKGRHYYFKQLNGVSIKSGNNWNGITGLDIKGDGGYVVAEDGLLYTFATGGVPLDQVPVFPSHLIEQSEPISEVLAVAAEDVRPTTVVGFESESPRIIEALRFIDADDRDEWCLDVGAALHHSSAGSTEAYQLYDTWSQKSKKYRGPNDTKRQWRSFDVGHSNPKTLASLYARAKRNGWDGNSGSAEFKQVRIPKADSVDSADLTSIAMDAIRSSFAANATYPSEAQFEAIKDICSNIEQQANGNIKPLYYLSSIDPGVGKTQAVIHSIRAMRSMQRYNDVGVTILLSRLQEIRKIANEMGLDESDYAVLVSDKSKEGEELNKLGNKSRDDAQVLFTTQQMLHARCREADSYAKKREFHFRGRRRLVTIWDEAALAARPISVNYRAIEGMTRVASDHSSTLVAMLDEIKDAVRSAVVNKAERSVIDIPDLKSACDLSVALELFSEESKLLLQSVSDLWELSGRTVTVLMDSKGNTILSFTESFPSDLKPMLILDASGRIRQTYDHWSDGRKDLVMLKDAAKDYSNLTLHLWKVGGSKSAWRKNAALLIEGIVNTIRSKPDEQWLIVHHKTTKHINVPAMLKDRLTFKEYNRLSFVHWGNHSASNDFRDIKNVILAGTLFYETSYYENLARLSRRMEPTDTLGAEEFKLVEKGEHGHLVLQAVCRGSVRVSDDGGCSPCDVYVIANPESGIPRMLEDETIFPRCTNVLTWSPVEVELTGNVKKAIDYIVPFFAKHPTQRLKLPVVAQEIGVERSNFNKDVVNHRDFEQALSTHGINLVRQKAPKPNYLAKNHGLDGVAPF